MRTVHHSSGGKTEDVVNEAFRSCHIVRLCPVASLCGRHVGSNVTRQWDCLNPKISKTLSD